ncbi:MAG: alpha/beta hydrolase [Ignavibacteria bacterium]|nr:alpha/beta hydrolase [Ignavibacteria bacterium]
MKIRLGLLLFMTSCALTAHAQKDILDVPYKTVESGPLLLDLHLPGNASGPVPLIIWIHGGGWRNGSKATCLPFRLGFTQRGYAVASINYRLTGEACFPAQIEDCKAAIRWLRAHAAEYGLDADRFGAWGSSAGGHLVSLLGTSGDIAEFDVGDNTNISSRVQAVCDYYGPVDFKTMCEVYKRFAQPDSPLSKLLGGPISTRPEAAKAASPITYITPDDPPFLIVHGDADGTVPVEQSRQMDAALHAAGLESELIILPGAGHGGTAFATSESIEKAAGFFDRHLK